jgi:hypothetical protein
MAIVVAAAGNVLFQNTYTLLIHFSTLKNNIQFPTFSLTALKVMIGVVVLGVGGVTCFLSASYTVQQQYNVA